MAGLRTFGEACSLAEKKKFPIPPLVHEFPEDRVWGGAGLDVYMLSYVQPVQLDGAGWSSRYTNPDQASYKTLLIAPDIVIIPSIPECLAGESFYGS